MTAAAAAANLAATGGGGDALALIRLLREAVAAAAPREALHLRLGGGGGPWLRQPHRRRLVEEALDSLRGAGRVRLFALPNSDLVAVAPPGLEKLREAEAVLRTLLFSDDGAAAPPAVARLRLPDEAAALFAAVEAALAPPAPNGAAAFAARGGGDGPPRAGFGPDDLAAMERGLAGADLSSFLRQRPVCRLGPRDAAPEAAWREWRVALPDLFAAFGSPGAGADGAPPWLLRRLRRALDRRLLAALARPERAAVLGAAAVCLSPASVGAPEFARFAEALGPAGRAAVAVETRAEDILADPAGFAAARDACRARGFRTALAEADPALLPVLPPRRLGLDLLHLRWSPGLPAAFAAAALPAGGGGSVVLTGADTAAAIGWGWEQGISLFEGRLLRPRGG